MSATQTRVKVVKNKVAPPFKQVEFDIMYGEGISKTGELIDLGVKAGVVEKSGAWFSYGDQRIGQGRENAKGFLAENTDIALEIEDKIRADHGLDFDAPKGPMTSVAMRSTRTPRSDLKRGRGARATGGPTPTHCAGPSIASSSNPRPAFSVAGSRGERQKRRQGLVRTGPLPRRRPRTWV